MNKKYQIRNHQQPHHVIMRTANGVNAFLDSRYKDYLISNLILFQEEKGLLIHSYVILNNQVHVIGSTKTDYDLGKIIGNFRRKIGIQMIKNLQSEADNQEYQGYLLLFKHNAQLSRSNKIYQFWEVNKSPVEMTSKVKLEELINGFHQAPVIERLTEDPLTYDYSSAKDFNGSSGRIRIDAIDYSVFDEDIR